MNIFNSLSRQRILLAFFALVFVIVGSLTWNYFYPSTPQLVWTMVNVNHTPQTSDAHLIQVNHGKTILIDAGSLKPAGEKLIPFLQANKIHNLDTVFITHAHENHYGGLPAILQAGIKIKEVYFKLPEKKVCDSEAPWGCNYQLVLRYHKFLKDSKVDIKTAKVGQEFALSNNAKLKVLYAFDGINTPVGETDVNDTSLIMMLEHAKHKYLFTGDLNANIGGYLADHSQDTAAEFLKVPHHGAESAAPNKFFEKVRAKYALVPGPKEIWCSERSARIRNWFKENKIPVFVNGLSGHVRVEDYKYRTVILPENPQNTECT
jgi:competence protein ComEC